MFGGARRDGREPWGPDIVVVVVLFAFATRWGLSPTGYIMLVCAAGAVVGYLQGRARKRTGSRSGATNLPQRVQGRPVGRPSAPSPRDRGPQRRYEHYEDADYDEFDEDWDDDKWDMEDEWDDDGPESYRRSTGGRRRRAESWETGGADYI